MVYHLSSGAKLASCSSPGECARPVHLPKESCTEETLEGFIRGLREGEFSGTSEEGTPPTREELSLRLSLKTCALALENLRALPSGVIDLPEEALESLRTLEEAVEQAPPGKGDPQEEFLKVEELLKMELILQALVSTYGQRALAPLPPGGSKRLLALRGESEERTRGLLKDFNRAGAAAHRAQEKAAKLAPLSRAEGFAILRERAAARLGATVNLTEEGLFPTAPALAYSESRREVHRGGWSLTGESLDGAYILTDSPFVEGGECYLSWTLPEVTGTAPGALRTVLASPGSYLLKVTRAGAPSPLFYPQGSLQGYLRSGRYSQEGTLEETFFPVDESFTLQKDLPALTREALEARGKASAGEDSSGFKLFYRELLEALPQRESYSGPAFDCTYRMPPEEDPYVVPEDLLSPQDLERRELLGPAFPLSDSLGSPRSSFPSEGTLEGSSPEEEALGALLASLGRVALAGGVFTLQGPVRLREAPEVLVEDLSLKRTPHGPWTLSWRRREKGAPERALTLGNLQALTFFLSKTFTKSR